MSSIQSGFMRQLLAEALHMAATGAPVEVKARHFPEEEKKVSRSFSTIDIHVGTFETAHITFDLFDTHGNIRLAEKDIKGNLTFLSLAVSPFMEFSEFIDYANTILLIAKKPSVAELFASVEPVETKENV